MNNHRRPLFAGVAKVDITPADPTGLLDIWKRSFEGVHDRLFLRALAVDNGLNDTPTFEVTSTPIQQGYAEDAIVHGLVEMMSRY